jgi:hypothetical protein
MHKIFILFLLKRKRKKTLAYKHESWKEGQLKMNSKEPSISEINFWEKNKHNEANFFHNCI